MTDDATLIAALRKCEHCESSGKFRGLACGWCRLNRMAADRIEAKNRQLASLDGELKAATACEIADRVREKCVREVETFDEPQEDGVPIAEIANTIRAITVEDLLQP